MVLRYPPESEPRPATDCSARQAAMRPVQKTALWAGCPEPSCDGSKARTPTRPKPASPTANPSAESPDEPTTRASGLGDNGQDVTGSSTLESSPHRVSTS